MNPPASERATCPNCGAELEETIEGGLGCLPCLLRVGLRDQESSATGDVGTADRRFGIYTIEGRDDGTWHELGRGAMGATYCAIDTTLRRKVALKIIKTELDTR